MKRYLLLILLISGCICTEPIVLSQNETETNLIETVVTVTSSVTTTSLLTPQRIQIIKKLQFTYANITLNMSIIQIQDLLNMKPDVCHTIGCSEGFHKAKVECLEILGIKGSKFSERPQSGILDIINKKEYTPYINLQTDAFSQYLELNANYWYISRDYTLKAFNISNSSIWDYKENVTSETKFSNDQTIIIRKR